MDLFAPIVSAELQHPNFRSICASQNGYNWDVLHNWARGFVDRDGKFVKELQTTFDSSFWELYIFAVLKKYSLGVDFSFNAPDFFIKDYGGFNIEATVALNAKGSTPEHMKFADPVPADLNEFNRKTTIRLRNSLDTKRIKFQESYSKLDHVKGRPFVLAITAVDNPHFILQCQRPIEAAILGYQVDEETYLKGGGNLEGYDISSVTKDNGTEIGVGLFFEQEYSWLSAVIFSSCATWGKVRALSSDPHPDINFTAVKYNAFGVNPHVIKAKKAQYSESLLDGLRIYHNPNALHPLSPDIFRHRDVYQIYYCEDEQKWSKDFRDGLLLFRSVQTNVKRWPLSTS